MPVSLFALLYNVETGVFFAAAIIFLEGIDWQAQKFHFRPKAVLFFIIIVFFGFPTTLGFGYGVSIPETFNFIINFFSILGVQGGEDYRLIPVFAPMFLHCSVILVRWFAEPQEEPIKWSKKFDTLIATWLLGWLIYFIARPNPTYIAVLFSVYLFLFSRLVRDLDWVLSSRSWCHIFATVPLVLIILVHMANLTEIKWEQIKNQRENLGAYTNSYTYHSNIVTSNSGGSAYHFRGADNDTTKVLILQNGDLDNANNSYSGLSDIKLKENIVDAGSQWDDIKNLKVRKFNFKAETGHETHTQIGLIAQETEPVSAGLVYEENDITVDESTGEGTVTGTTKHIKYSVLYMKAIKALQEAMERIEKLEDDNTALRARITNLEGN